ncbi:MAG: hypothetical protein ACLFP1_08695 [Candidatus Goldiibacteriota bacterium]
MIKKTVFAAVCLLLAGACIGADPDTTGRWCGSGVITGGVHKGKDFMADLNIMPDNSVQGRIGGMKIDDAYIRAANAWQKMIYESGYIIKGTGTGGVRENSEPVKRFVIAFSLNNSIMSGEFLSVGRFFLITKFKADINAQRSGAQVPQMQQPAE